MLLTLKLLALSPMLALRFRLVLIAAGAGALAGLGYTLLTGAEVPTVRACIAALLVLAGIALGRDALTLRLVAVGALVVLLLWPESLPGRQLPDELRRDGRDRRPARSPAREGAARAP
jgi:competence protein ComEC